jgi:hypothetical protein
VGQETQDAHNQGPPLSLPLPNKATEIFISWLNANEDERAKAILLVFARDQPVASHQRYFVYLLNAIWDRHKSASALRLLVYEVMAVDFGYVFEHLCNRPQAVVRQLE